MYDLRPTIRTTAALIAVGAIAAAIAGQASVGLIVGIVATVGNLALIRWAVERSSQGLARGGSLGLADAVLVGKLPLTVLVLAGLGSLFGAGPVLAGLTLVMAAFTLALGGHGLAAAFTPTPVETL